MEDREERHNSLLPIKEAFFLINVAFEKWFDLSSTAKLMLTPSQTSCCLVKKKKQERGQKANRHFQRTRRTYLLGQNIKLARPL